MKNHIKKTNRIVVSLALALVLMSSLLFASCGIFGTRVKELTLELDALKLNVGQSVTIDSAYYKLSPSNASNKEAELMTSDSAVMSVSGNTVTGVSAGTCALTIRSKSNSSAEGTMAVTVSAVEPEEISIIYDGQIFQDAGQTSNVIFSPGFGLVSAPGKTVAWSVTKNGTAINESSIAASENYFFTPDSHGRYTVKAATLSRESLLSDTLDINVYKPYIAEPVMGVSGTLIQEEDEYSAVVFSADYTDDPENPERVIEWKVNGTVFGTDRTFSFKPAEAGIHPVELFINGAVIDSANITAKGSIIPKNLKFEFDNSYPNVFLSWDTVVSGLGYEVRIYDEQNRLVHSTDISTAHSATSSLFRGTQVNLTSIIGKDAAKNIFNTSFKMQVKSLGGVVGFKESEYSQALTTAKIPAAAQKYLEKAYYSSAKNYFLTDEEEFVDILAYFYLWRSLPVLGSNDYDTGAYEVYLNFNVINEYALVSNANSALHFTGRTSTSAALSNNVLKLNIRYETDSLPSKSTNITSSDRKGGLGSVRPHVDYNKNNARTSLPVESVSPAVEVESTEQLYYVAQLGYRPVPKTGSKAESVYNYAKSVLVQIINNSMTDIDKAHAIYDWVMWQVNYDWAALSISDLKESVKYNTYYLEGVFNNDWNYAVCDGIAKAYALMCNMEKIPCIRVAGMAGDEAPAGADRDAWIAKEWGGHAWNKVKLNGSWYIVDATWGDGLIEFNPNGGTVVSAYEFAFHQYFLLTDKEVESRRAEDKPNYYPRTATVPYNFYADTFEYGGETYDFFFNSGEDAAREKADRLAGYMVTAIDNGKRGTSDLLFDPMFSKRNEADQYFPGSPKNQHATNNFVAFDIKISMTLRNAFLPQNANGAFRNAFAKLGYRFNIDYQMLEVRQFGYSYLFIIISI